MKNLTEAMSEEKKYIADRLNDINSSIIERLSQYGYDNLTDYFKDKKEYLFNEWKPEVIYIDVKDLTVGLENAIHNEQYGVYISVSNDSYAFHGSDYIDYNLAEKLGVYVAELYHKGGTIIGGSGDLGIEIVAPVSIELDADVILKKFYEIISKYMDNVEISGNDILVNGKKVLGSMSRRVGNAFIWAAQVSFEDHSELINQLCNKKSIKQPSYIDSNILNKDMFEKEVLKWLQKQ